MFGITLHDLKLELDAEAQKSRGLQRQGQTKVKVGTSAVYFSRLLGGVRHVEDVGDETDASVAEPKGTRYCSVVRARRRSKVALYSVR